MTRKKIKTLIVGAYAGELKPFVDLGKKHFQILGEVAYLSAGIGPVAASFGLTHFLEDFAPEEIFAVGTAGIIDNQNLAIGQIVEVDSLSYEGRGGFSNESDVYVPDLQVSEVQFSKPANDFEGLPLVRVFAPQEISRGGAWQEYLLKQSYQVEHLESFAYAFVAQKFKIPLTILLGLTNHIGKSAHAEWRKHEKDVMKKLADTLCGHLSLS